MSQQAPPQPDPSHRASATANTGAASSSWLDAIQAPESSPEIATISGQVESSGSQAFSSEKGYLEKRQELELKDYEQDIAARKSYANKLFWLIAVWLTAILVILVAAGFGTVGRCPFRLSDLVLTALIGSTTATVLGLFIVVVNYLFPQRKSPPR